MKNNIILLVLALVCGWLAYHYPEDMAVIARYILPAAVAVLALAGMIRYGRVGVARHIGISLLRFAEREENRQRARKQSQYASLRALAEGDLTPSGREHQ